MTRSRLNIIAWLWSLVVIALAMLLLSSCNVLKDKQSRSLTHSQTDTASVRTTETNVRKESGAGKEDSKYEKETTITPTVIRDTINNTVKVYPTTVIREKGEVQKEYIYINTDSTRIDRIEQALSTLALTMAEQTKHKESGTPWYVWFFGSFMLLTVLAIIYLLIRNK